MNTAPVLTDLPRCCFVADGQSFDSSDIEFSASRHISFSGDRMFARGADGVNMRTEGNFAAIGNWRGTAFVCALAGGMTHQL